MFCCISLLKLYGGLARRICEICTKIMYLFLVNHPYPGSYLVVTSILVLPKLDPRLLSSPRIGMTGGGARGRRPGEALSRAA